MTTDDLHAAYELAAYLSWADAMRFLRKEINCGLREALGHTECAAERFPASPLAESLRRRRVELAAPAGQSTGG